MKINVLVVDDDKLANDFFVETLSRDGYKVDTAYSGEEALEKLQERPFDIMLSDIKMKGMDGIELLENANGLQSGLISIMVTAFGTVENAVKAMKLGAHDFLLKPVTPEAL